MARTTAQVYQAAFREDNHVFSVDGVHINLRLDRIFCIAIISI